jgi:hypothetical protein
LVESTPSPRPSPPGEGESIGRLSSFSRGWVLVSVRKEFFTEQDGFYNAPGINSR